MKKLTLLLTILTTLSCRPVNNFGFFQPITMNMETPDGPPEFKAGWYAGCRSGIGMTHDFANAYIYLDSKNRPLFGSGIYQHDPVYQSAWGTAFWACREQGVQFVYFNAMKHGPLE